MGGQTNGINIGNKTNGSLVGLAATQWEGKRMESTLETRPNESLVGLAGTQWEDTHTNGINIGNKSKESLVGLARTQWEDTHKWNQHWKQNKRISCWVAGTQWEGTQMESRLENQTNQPLQFSFTG